MHAPGIDGSDENRVRRISDQAYVISNGVVNGDTVTWDSVWGEDGCVKAQSAVVKDGTVKDGTILTWTWVLS